MRNGLQTKGFSILELLIVVTLIGILALVILPKVTNINQQLQLSDAEKAAATIGAAVNIAHSSWIAAGGATTAQMLKVDGRNLIMSKHGWPESSGLQDSSGAMTANKCLDIWNNLIESPPSANLIDKCDEYNCEFAVKVSEKNPAECMYIDNGGKGFNVIVYDINSGNVTLTSK